MAKCEQCEEPASRLNSWVFKAIKRKNSRPPFVHEVSICDKCEERLIKGFASTKKGHAP